MTAGRVTLAILAAVVLLSLVDRIRGARRSTLGRILVAVVRAYQRWISPVRPPVCRFSPTCSAYAVTAIERFGPLRGGWLAARRLLRCGPWHPGGHDPVPSHVGHRVTCTSADTPEIGAAASTPTGETRC